MVVAQNSEQLHWCMVTWQRLLFPRVLSAVQEARMDSHRHRLGTE